ncbi:hypothetical protein SVAN01_07625 [Stagonosporopsis vannaccii]|nr:hypothetical protein SVAN01_07625 [Stagonosporopsis vannaccii]
MPTPVDDVLLSLQSSLRNALATFGPGSVQVREIRGLCEEYEARLRLEGLSLSCRGEQSLSFGGERSPSFGGERR